MDNCEILMVLKVILDLIRHQEEFIFPNIMLTNFENVKHTIFFHQREVFMGHSMVDVHLNDLTSINLAF